MGPPASAGIQGNRIAAANDSRSTATLVRQQENIDPTPMANNRLELTTRANTTLTVDMKVRLCPIAMLLTIFNLITQHRQTEPCDSDNTNEHFHGDPFPDSFRCASQNKGERGTCVIHKTTRTE